MKRLVVLGLSVFLSTVAIFAASGEKRYVCVQNLSVKSSTGIFASTIEKIKYGDEVILIEEKGKYSKIETASKKTGWVATSSLTKKKIIQNSNVTASQEEIALAGKGFSAEIESEYKLSGNYNYEAVDELEKNTVDEKTLQEFFQKRNFKTE